MTMNMSTSLPARVAVLIPCHNEAAAIAQVVSDFRSALPHAQIYVYDNNSSDDTMARAEQAGAIVRSESHQGKGHVVRRMFADVQADCYLLVDGDATYHAASAPDMIRLMQQQQLDLVNGRRVSTEAEAYRAGHVFGNKLFSSLIGHLFGHDIQDVLSGYKVMSRRFVKSFPVRSGGFEVETELAVHAMSLGVALREVDTPYHARPAGSQSKLRAIPDGLRILRVIASLFKEERPRLFFGAAAGILAALSILLALPLLGEYLRSGLVPRLPTAVLCTGIMISALLSGAIGVILDSVKRGQREIKRLLYLQLN